MRVLIMANGDPPSMRSARAAVAQHDLLIAVDGAAHVASALGLKPGLICGDFDSMDRGVAEIEFPNAEFVETPDQYLADLEKALLLARERGATEIAMIGAGGGRVDHSLSAIALLVRYCGEIALTLLDDGSAMRAVSGTADAPGALHLETRPGETVSLIAFAPENRVSISGVRWPLEDVRLPVGTRGVSNVATGESVLVEVTVGVVMVCHLWEF